MLYDLEPFAAACDTRFSISDLTVVIAVRAHAQNPWVLPRLALLREYYEPLPQVVICDFGSATAFSEDIANLCAQQGLTYCRVDDQGVFSLSSARNRGFEQVKTDLVFFSDVDCFGSRDLFQGLVDQANTLQLGLIFDQVINLPVYHLSEAATAHVLAEPHAVRRGQLLARAMARKVYAVDDKHSFIDAHSNFFLLHRRFFDLVGGYDEAFRGYGSEDFEFLLRLCLHSRQFPLPAEPLRDEYGPLAPENFASKRYLGFRRLFEVMALQTETSGLRIAHLHHPRPRSADSWYDQNDGQRKRFHKAAAPLLERPHELLTRDWLQRPKRALVLLSSPHQYGLFLPLRLAGYRLDLYRPEGRHEDNPCLVRLQAGGYDAVAIFNPYMASNAELRQVFDAAKAKGAKPIVIERGALPESFYYAADVSYSDPEFSRAHVDAAPLRPEDLTLAEAYQAELRRGESTLERQGDLTSTLNRHQERRAAYEHTCLIPLQLDDDMAVTQFTTGHPSYPEFLAQLEQTVKTQPQVLFLVKSHPLSKRTPALKNPNVVLCGAEDHIHALLELSDSVMLYNSGVGLLALIHHKPLATVGNAFYNLAGLGLRASSTDEAMLALRDRRCSPDPVAVTRLVAWLLTQKYAFFKADSIIHDFGFRRSHAYTQLDFYAFNYQGHHIRHRRAARSLPMDAQSYGAARLGTNVASLNSSFRGTGALRKLLGGPRHETMRRKLNKLRRDPQRFFADSRSPMVRWFARAISLQSRS